MHEKQEMDFFEGLARLRFVLYTEACLIFMNGLAFC